MKGCTGTRVDGIQPQTLVATSIVGRRAPTSWSPDGRFVLHTLNNPKTSSDIWTLTLGATPTVEPFLESSASESQGQFSPAATQPLLVAYTSNETGRDEVFVRTFPDAGNRQMVSRNGGHSPRWRGDGRELFYVAADGMLMSVTFTDVGPRHPDAALRGASRFRVERCHRRSGARPVGRDTRWTAVPVCRAGARQASRTA